MKKQTTAIFLSLLVVLTSMVSLTAEAARRSYTNLQPSNPNVAFNLQIDDRDLADIFVEDNVARARMRIDSVPGLLASLDEIDVVGERAVFSVILTKKNAVASQVSQEADVGENVEIPANEDIVAITTHHFNPNRKRARFKIGFNQYVNQEETYGICLTNTRLDKLISCYEVNLTTTDTVISEIQPDQPLNKLPANMTQSQVNELFEYFVEGLSVSNRQRRLALGFAGGIELHPNPDKDKFRSTATLQLPTSRVDVFRTRRRAQVDNTTIVNENPGSNIFTGTFNNCTENTVCRADHDLQPEGTLYRVTQGNEEFGKLFVKNSDANADWVEIADGSGGGTGPQGPKGDPGAPGAPGQNGQDGEDGKSLTPRGNFDPTVNYFANDFIFVAGPNGGTFIAPVDIAAGGAAPTANNPGPWQPLALNGQGGAGDIEESINLAASQVGAQAGIDINDIDGNGTAATTVIITTNLGGPGAEIRYTFVGGVPTQVNDVGIIRNFPGDAPIPNNSANQDNTTLDIGVYFEVNGTGDLVVNIDNKTVDVKVVTIRYE